MPQSSSRAQGWRYIGHFGASLTLYSSSSLSKLSQHSGAIKALQFNPHRDDLLASSGSKGELYITNIANPAEPSSFKLGASTARADDFDALDWNKKVAHILVTGSSGGFATVWDVRSKKESITLNNYGRKPVSSIAWDPSTSTKVATATSSDQDPVICLWDLRNTNAPEKVLKHHEQGILSLSWSRADPRLLLSCGKDNRTICWNAEAGEPFGEFPIVTNWTFQTSWNPKHPGLLATGSFDGKIAIQTIQNANSDTSDASVAESLDGADFFASAQSRPQGASFSLPVPPNWLKRPVSATFGFAGKLVQVANVDPKHSKIKITTFVSESSVGDASQKFEDILQTGDIKEFCDSKIAEAKSANDKSDWTVIETLISGSRTQLKEYLGFSEEDSKPNGDITFSENKEKSDRIDADDTSFFDKDASDDSFLSGIAASKGAKTNNPFSIYTGKESESDKQITRALILGKFEDALDICLKEERISDAFMVAICGGEKCIEKAKSAYFKQVTGGPNYLRLLASVAGKNLWDVVYNADLEQWKEVMAAICTYADEKDFSDLCEALGDRIEESGDRGDASFCYLAGSKLEKVVTIWLNELTNNEKASIEDAEEDSSYYSIHANALQTFIEKVTIFRKVTEFQDDERDAAQDWKLASLYDKYAEYADILASQGHLQTAEKYLDLLPSKYPTADVARNRVRQATRKGAGVADQKSAAQVATRGQRVVQTFQPVQTPSIPTPNAMSNAYNPGPAFTPAASQVPSSYNPPGGRSAYTPMGYQAPQQGYQTQHQGYQPPQQSQAYQPPSAAIPAAQPFAAPTYNQFGGVAPPPRATTQSPAITPAARQAGIPAWNDTPDVGPRAIPRRGTPSVVHPPPNSGYAGHPSSVAPPTAYGAPPKSSTPVPPPPKPGVGRTLSPANVAPAPVSIGQRTASAAANTYSPPPSTISSMPPPVQRGASPYNPPPSAGSTSNRYAPAPGAQPTAPSSYQPGPPSQKPISSPYAPQAGGYGQVPPPIAAAPIPTPGPPRGPPPKGSGLSRIQAPPPAAPGSRIVNSLPSPQPSTSRPPSSGSAQASPALQKYRK